MFCRAAGSLVSCDDGALTLRVVRLGNSNYDSSRDRVGYSGREEDPFLIRVNYRHAFMTPMVSSVPSQRPATPAIRYRNSTCFRRSPWIRRIRLAARIERHSHFHRLDLRHDFGRRCRQGF